MSDVVTEVLDYLEAQSLAGTGIGWPAYASGLPATPDALVAVFETGGRTPETKYPLEYPEFQVRVRGTTASGGYAAARTRMTLISDALRAIRETVLGSNHYAAIMADSGVIALGRDDNLRPEFAQTFTAFREPNA